ncbi:MAG: hypothetical protein WC781_05335 [Candidatus Pacearchaeota archaeon]|jgi:hypothetical protein
MKKLIVIFCLILAISFASAFNFGISPGQIQLNGNVGELICQNLSLITSDNKVTATGEDKWIAQENEVRKITDYVDTASDYGLEAVYPKNIQVTKSYSVNFCVKGTKAGEYYGVIVYRTTGQIGAASWVKVKLTEKSNNAPITGAVVGNNSNKMVLLGMVLSTVVLVVVLFVLLSIKRDVKKDSEEKSESEELKKAVEDEQVEEIKEKKKKKKPKAI